MSTIAVVNKNLIQNPVAVIIMLEWQTLAFVLFILVRRFLKSLETHASIFSVPQYAFYQMSAAVLEKKLHHVVFGPADRTKASHCIVLIHGWSQSGSAWMATAKALHAKYPDAVIIVPDLIGHGRSSDACAELDLSIPLFVKQIEFLVRTLNCAHLPLHLAGISMGGAVALSASRYLPLTKLKPRQLVLAAPAGIENPFVVSPLLIVHLLRFVFVHRLLWLVLTGLSFCFPRLHAWARRILLAVRAPTYDIDKGVFNMDETMHVHLVWGQKDNMHDFKLSEFYLKNIPNVHLKSVPQWGHSQICHQLSKLRLEQFDDMWIYNDEEGKAQSTMVIKPIESNADESGGSSKSLNEKKHA